MANDELVPLPSPLALVAIAIPVSLSPLESLLSGRKNTSYEELAAAPFRFSASSPIELIVALPEVSGSVRQPASAPGKLTSRQRTNPDDAAGFGAGFCVADRKSVV